MEWVGVINRNRWADCVGIRRLQGTRESAPTEKVTFKVAQASKRAIAKVKLFVALYNAILVA